VRYECRLKARQAPLTPLPRHVPSLIDDRVGAGEDGRREGEPDRRGRLGTQDHLELGRLLDRQVGRLGAVQDAIDVAGGLARQAGIARSV
jgi:hypothetical protein